MRWLSRIGPADLLTLGNGFLGVLAITYILDGEHVTATLLLFLAVLVDGMDGTVARRYGSPHDFGRFLDSISDAVSFVLAPSLIIYDNFYDKALGSAWTSPPNAAAVIATMVFATSGLLRLARFAGRDFRRRDFLGLPTPAAAMLAATICLLWGRPVLNPFGLGYAPYPAMAVIFVLGPLMLSDIRYPKPRGWLAGAAACSMAFGGLALLAYLAGLADHTTASRTTMLFLALLAAYAVLGPAVAGGGRGSTRTSGKPRQHRTKDRG